MKNVIRNFSKGMKRRPRGRWRDAEDRQELAEKNLRPKTEGRGFIFDANML